MRSRKVHSYLLVLLGIILTLAVPVAAGMKAAFAASGQGSRSGDAATLGRLLSTRLEDDVAPELMVDLDLYRRVLTQDGISAGALNANQAACPQKKCPAPGQPYTGRGCERIFRCPGGK